MDRAYKSKLAAASIVEDRCVRCSSRNSVEIQICKFKQGKVYRITIRLHDKD